MALAMSEWVTIASSLVGSLIVGSATAFWTIYKYRHEKLWEARHDLYRRILQSLSVLDSRASHAIDVECVGINTISKSVHGLWLEIESEQRNLEAQLADAQLVLPVEVVNAIGEVLKAVRGQRLHMRRHQLFVGMDPVILETR